MQTTMLQVTEDFQEKPIQSWSDFPFAIYTNKLNHHKEGFINWHWHNEIQFSYCLQNETIFFIEDQKITLKAGEGILVNSNVLHQIKPNSNKCKMFSIVFATSVIGGGRHSLIEKKYIEPILNGCNLRFIHLKDDVQWQAVVLQKLLKIFSLWNHEPYGYELEIVTILGSAWLDVIREVKVDMSNCDSTAAQYEERVKQILAYIHEHYTENISLNNMAAYASISNSECCRSFKRFLKVTPFEYLLEYRILKASDLLLGSNKPVSDIAFDVGFNGTSYFGKVFKKHTNYTPSEYRKLAHRESKKAHA